MKNSHLVLTGIIAFIMLTIAGCSRCRNKEAHQNVPLPSLVKDSLFGFPAGTRWIFQSNLGDKDTVYLGALVTTYTEGSCVDGRDCCTKYNNETVQQDLNFILDSDGLEKYSGHTDDAHHVLHSSNTDLELSTDQLLDQSYKSTFVINGRTLNDIEVNQQYWTNIHPTLPYKVYWSLGYGLVHYEYKQSDGTIITYERTDL